MAIKIKPRQTLQELFENCSKLKYWTRRWKNSEALLSFEMQKEFKHELFKKKYLSLKTIFIKVVHKTFIIQIHS